MFCLDFLEVVDVVKCDKINAMHVKNFAFQFTRIRTVRCNPTSTVFLLVR